MDIEYWAARWKQGRIGFHEQKPNAFLERHVDRLGTSRRVLVPLCGKTEDMAFLASRGHEVVGIEAVEDAVVAFFTEHGLEHSVRDGAVRACSAERVTILAGDVFACTSAEVGRVDALYDRAALVALPPDARQRYVTHLRALLTHDAPGLVVTFEYDETRAAGPPFSVREAEIRELFHGAKVTPLGEAPANTPRFREAGVDAIERCFAIEAA